MKKWLIIAVAMTIMLFTGGGICHAGSEEIDMAIYHEDIASIDLENGNIYRSFLSHTIGYGDDDANRFGIRAFRNGVPETLGGTCAGFFIRADGATVVIADGVVSGNMAYVTLPEACYAVEGNFTLAIKVSGSGVTGTMRIVDGVVSRTSTSATVDPGTIIPSVENLIDAIDAAVASIPQDYSSLLGTIVDDYSNSRTYEVGEYAWYSGVLKKCIVPITTAESYTAAHWTDAIIMDDVSDSARYVSATRNKNILPLQALATTVNDVVFTPYDNGTIKMNGTASGTIYYTVGALVLYEDEKYILSGMPADGISLQVLNENNTQVIVSQNNGSEQAFTVSATGVYNVRITTYSGKVVSNVIVSPMIRRSDTGDGIFVPFGNNDIAVFIGDSYSQANSMTLALLNRAMRFTSQVSRKMGWQEKNFAVGGMGFLEGETTFEDQLDNAIADTTYNHADVKHVIIAGGLNDMSADNLSTDLAGAVKSVIDKASAEYGNAKIIVIPMLNYNTTISQQGFFVYKTIANACRENKCCLIPNAYTWLVGMEGMILSDGVHPNIDGHTLIASHIVTALTTGDSFPYPASCSLSVYSDKIDTNENAYCCELLEGTQITVNAVFTLTESVSRYTKLFEYTNANSKNNPLFIGNYGKNIPCFNMDTGAAGVLLVNQETSGNGYKNHVSAYTTLAAGTWKVLSAGIEFGVQEYSGNMN